MGSPLLSGSLFTEARKGRWIGVTGYRKGIYLRRSIDLCVSHSPLCIRASFGASFNARVLFVKMPPQCHAAASRLPRLMFGLDLGGPPATTPVLQPALSAADYDHPAGGSLFDRVDADEV
jgi:hypothetical protein